MTGERRTVAAPPSQLPGDAADMLLALADDELVIGHRHSEWLGLSPFLEEDLTLSSIAQDEFGHARALYALIWPEWTDREAGVTRRPAAHWRSCALVELDGKPWELSLARHFLYDVAEPMRWTAMLDQYGDAVEGLAQLVPTVLAEERFHARHAIDLIVRLGSDPAGAQRLQPHLDALAPLAAAMLQGLPPSTMTAFAGQVAAALAGTALSTPFEPWPDGLDVVARSQRSVGFADVHESLLAVIGFDPAARW